jgi:UDP-N-acetylglucosamine/UDP-N-acetylgalactosamine diphosphorylase
MDRDQTRGIRKGTTMTTATLDTVKTTLESAGQAHLLTFFDELGEAERASLLEQIAAIDFEALPGLIDAYVRSDAHFEVPADLEPAPYYPRDPESGVRAWDRDAMKRAGERLIAEGKIGCFTVAGGRAAGLGTTGRRGATRRGR